MKREEFIKLIKTMPGMPENVIDLILIILGDGFIRGNCTFHSKEDDQIHHADFWECPSSAEEGKFEFEYGVKS